MTNAVAVAQYGGVGATKNRIINGAMMIDQRNGGASVSTPVGGAGAATYGVDRFSLYNQTEGGYSVQQVSDAPAGLKYSLKVTTTTAAGGSPAASALAFVNQTVEAYNISDINEGTANAQSLTLSFWVKSSLTGSFTVTAENNNDRTFLTTYTINSASTWEKKTVVIPPCVDGTWNVTNGRGIIIRWGLLGGSTYQQAASASWQSIDAKFFVTGTVALAQTLNATLQLSGVQLEAGTTATAFEQRLYGTELALCQRYYQQIVKGSAQLLGTATFFSSTRADGIVFLPVAMRTTPSFSIVTGTNYYRIYIAGNSYNCPSVTFNESNYANDKVLYFNNTDFSAMTNGAGWWESQSANAAIGLTAEL